MSYVDGYVLVIPTKNVEEYRQMANKAGGVWKKHGALSYVEAAAEDLDIKGFPGVNFKTMAGAKEDETVIFAYVTYYSREHRDEVNAKVMADPELEGACENMPFDPSRMAYGGFKAIVSY